jgi:hypothetical protein
LKKIIGRKSEDKNINKIENNVVEYERHCRRIWAIAISSYSTRVCRITVKDAVKSVLRIGSAHNKGGPTDVNIAQTVSHLLNFFLNWNSGLYSFTSIPNQNSVIYSVSISYFTNIPVRNVNKAFVYITDLTAPLNILICDKKPKACQLGQVNSLTPRSCAHFNINTSLPYQYLPRWAVLVIGRASTLVDNC